MYVRVKLLSLVPTYVSQVISGSASAGSRPIKRKFRIARPPIVGQIEPRRRETGGRLYLGEQHEADHPLPVCTIRARASRVTHGSFKVAQGVYKRWTVPVFVLVSTDLPTFPGRAPSPPSPCVPRHCRCS